MEKLNVILKLGLVSISKKRVNNNKNFALKDYCFLLGHMCSFDDLPVLNYVPYKFKRLIKKSLFVIKDKPLLNK